MNYDRNTTYVKLENWCLLTVLGVGGTANVYKGFNPVTKKHAAIKIFKPLSQKDSALFKNEVEVQTILCTNTNFLKIQEFHESASLTNFKGAQKATALVLDLAQGGDVMSLIQNKGAFPDILARTYFHQLIDAVEHLERNNIAHRDIKPENIMLDEDYCIKVADFGCAARYTPIKKYFKTPAGTTKYFPPEVHRGHSYEGIQVDLFATAIIVFCMAVGHMPFTKASESDHFYSFIVRRKVKQFWRVHEEYHKDAGGIGISSDFKDVVLNMLDPNPSRRLSIEDIKKSAWYKKPILEKSEIAQAVKGSD